MQRCGLFVGLISLGACTGTEVSIAPTPNLEPSVIINSPIDETVFLSNEVIEFVGTVSDPNGLADIQSVSWISSIDGELSSYEVYAPDPDGISRFDAILTYGNHLISLSATDSEGLTAVNSVTVTVGVENPEPIPQILDPMDGDTFVEGDSISLIGYISDPQYAVTEVEARWFATDELTSDVYEILTEYADDQGDTVGTWDDAPIGSFIISLEATNPGDFVFTDEVSITVEDPLDQDYDGDKFTPNEGDCDDNDPYTYPDADELPDGVDNDCDGTIDEGTVLFDDDGDGFCESAVDPCSDGTLNGDCDDTDPLVNPAANEVCNDNIDNDCDNKQNERNADDCVDYFYDLDTDTWGTTATVGSRCYCNPTNEWTAIRDGDCNDNDIAINPGAPEIADGIDNNCDGYLDEGTDLYDNDGDGYCADSTHCTDPTVLPGDCDDADDDINPGEFEICGDGVDNDCSGTENDLNALGCDDYYLDGDGDTFGHPTDAGCYCEPSGDYEVLIPLNTDCNDANAAIHPNATELPDGIDNNCDGNADEGTALYDNDGDGYCADTTSCTDPSVLPNDCDDTDDDINPGEFELCGDGIDNNCDNDLNSEGAIGCATYYLDNDADNYGHQTESRCYCEANGDYDVQSPLNTDCDDSDVTVNPGATEIADTKDQNCNGILDEGTIWYDDDGDGFCEDASFCTDASHLPGDCDDTNALRSPNAVEICGDGVDNNCNGDQNDQNAMYCVDFYPDNDGDGDGAGSPICTCSSPGVNWSVNTDDCYDSTSDNNGDSVADGYPVHDGQTSYYSIQRGDGSYDYDCDGSETKVDNRTQAYSCKKEYFLFVLTGCDSSAGWVGGAPSCGQTRTWRDACEYTWFSGDIWDCQSPSSTTVTQSCR